MKLDEKTRKKLQELHQSASKNTLSMMSNLTKGIFGGLTPKHMETSYMAIGKEDGEKLFDRIIENNYTHIVEYGTSFGVSTIYLAAAAKLTDGKVITAELLPSKVKIAQQNFIESGLEDYIELREGDALETLTTIKNKIDLFFMDGWAEINIPLLQKLEDNFLKGTTIVLDNANFKSANETKKYLNDNAKFEVEPYPKGGRTFVAVYK